MSRTWTNGGAPYLSAENLQAMESDITYALGVPDGALAARINDPASSTAAALNATYVATAGTASPTVIKSQTNTMPGVFEWINDSTGTIFHLLVGANATKTATWLITMGGDNPGNGILWNAKTQGVGIKIDQNSTVTGSDSYGLQVTQMNANAPAAFFATNVNGAADTVQLFSTSAVTSMTQNLLSVLTASGANQAGRIRAADGVIDWKADVLARGSSLRARDASLDADANTHHLYMDSTGWEVDASSGSANQWWVGKIARDGWSMKFQGSTGFGGKGGSGTTLSTLITIGYGAKLSFFDAAPVSKQTVPAAATDAATTQSLANSLRTALINLGLTS